MPNLMTPLVAAPIARSTIEAGSASLIAYASGPSEPNRPTLVFLHAAVCDSRMWADQFSAFATTHRVVAYDRRGFGATAMVDEHFSSVDDLWVVLDAMQIDRVILVGCSQGGRIALDATLERPDRVAGLVLVAAAIGGAPESATHDPRLDALIARHAQAEADGNIDERNRIEAHVWLDGPFSPEGRVSGGARELFLAMNHIVLTTPPIGRTTVPETAYARLAQVPVPTMLVWGPLDVPGVIHNMQHAAATIPQVCACELDGVAHLPSLEAPARFNAVLAAFLDELPGA